MSDAVEMAEPLVNGSYVRHARRAVEARRVAATRAIVRGGRMNGVGR